MQQASSSSSTASSRPSRLEGLRSFLRRPSRREHPLAVAVPQSEVRADSIEQHLQGQHKPNNDLEWILSEKSHLNIGEFITKKQEHASGLGASCDVLTAWSVKHHMKVAIKRIRAFLLEDKKFAKVSDGLMRFITVSNI